ncbi:MAG: low molecular weight phosphotyrosine protein phosphatase [Ruminococcaceae bacterium]|nr:low molecular weight phosphotyrosine protein phosphatase [Oscillospiraceae bacterium]MBQ9913514.1 low molecular weight phosphotyrosine protein phosphatase [Clostridia bacterium]
MTKIMFVCHGNICRSPMAEFIFKDLINKQGRGSDFLVCSSATSTEEIWGGTGNPVYPPAAAELKRHGISCEGKRAVQLKKSDYDKYDLFIAMDNMNVRNIGRIFGKDPEGKVCKLMDFTDRKGRDVADPWYSGEFGVAYRDIYDGCTGLLEQMIERQRI